MIRFIVTSIKANGQREVVFTRDQTYETSLEAETMLKAILKNNSLETLNRFVGRDLEVRQVECWPTGESKQLYFDDEDEKDTGTGTGYRYHI